jgi:hypothetical protein
LNSQKTFLAQTIFVSNHPSAFIDPLVVANFQLPILNFMTRSDVFKWWLKPITWACHMVPIYRADQDGGDTYGKNQNVFRGIQKVLKRKKSLILFGEGYTDNVFIRSLKPMKKGAPRIGFSTMENTNWELDIKVQPVGLNYTDPTKFRADCVLSFGEIIHLKDYKEIYDENPNKAITQLMKDIGLGIQANLTYIEDKTKADFLEQLLILTRKGMNHEHHDRSYSVEERFNYSRALAQRINAEYAEDASEWKSLEETCQQYFEELRSKKIDDGFVHSYVENGNKKNLWKSWLSLFLLLPIFIAGTIHNAIPYYLTKTFVEKKFKRKVFWGGVKMVLGGLVWLLYSLPIFWLFPEFIHPSPVLATLYFFSIPAITFIIWHYWKKKLSRSLKFNRIKEADLKGLAKKRELVLKAVNQMNI